VIVISVRLVAIFSFMFSSCALLKPSASIGLSKISDDYQLNQNDTTKTVIDFNSKINFDFDLSGSQRVSIHPGRSRFLADGVSPGWFYLDFIGSSMWVRGLPVYLIGGDTVSLDIDNNYLDIDGMSFFDARQNKSTQYSFVPALLLSCVGCTREPILKLDGQQVDYTTPWISVDAGWHTIEIYSPFDNVNLYYRTLFDNYTITEFTLYPVAMN
jgi:hypothetical protein